MAPGCFAQSPKEEAANNNAQNETSPVKAAVQQPIKSMGIVDADESVSIDAQQQRPKRSSELYNPLFLLYPAVERELPAKTTTSMPSPPLKQRRRRRSSRRSERAAASKPTNQTPTVSASLGKERFSYLDEINLDEIPLPLTPPPPRDNEDNQGGLPSARSCHSRRLLVASSSSSTKTKKRESFHSLIFDYTVDTFEILEQTIIKQKRLVKLKNPDLRKKVLLKRTFDLICDTMDVENGLAESSVVDEPLTSSGNNISSSSPPQDETSSYLELELHDRDTRMDLDDEDEQEEETTTTSPVKLESTAAVVATDDDESQVAPRALNHQSKRRLSADDEDDEDENDEEDRETTSFYDYSFNGGSVRSAANDQQLNFGRRRRGVKRDATPQLNIYSYDSSAAAAALLISKIGPSITNHQRKRVKVN